MGVLFKLIYSALLVGIAAIAARELWNVWFDTQVYIGKFDVVSEAGKDVTASEAFPTRIVAAQTILAQQLTDYQARNTADAPGDATYAISGAGPLQLPREALGGIDITVQNINLKQLLTAVRRGFLDPNEVTGKVAQREGSVLAAVEWPRAAASANGASLKKFLVPSKPTAQEVAAYIAAAGTDFSSIWLTASSGS